jgi:Domain of Unknown Function with PDB structure (DUF3857)/Transglutaminase-like superfamily
MKPVRAFLALPFTFLIAITSSIPSPAADWPPVSPDELKMTAEPLAPGALAIILNREETVDDINSVYREYVRMKILREAGRDIADIEVLYPQRWYSVGDISGRTIHPDGSIAPFEAKPFDKTVIRGRGIRENVKSFTLPDVQVGSIVDYQYDIRPKSFSGRYFLLSQPTWFVQQNLFQKRVRFKYVPISADRMSHLYSVKSGHSVEGVAWTSYLPPNLPQPQSHEIMTHVVAADTDPRRASQVIDLELTDVAALTPEPYMPPADLLRWRIAFYVVTERNKNEFWKTEGKQWNKETQDFVQHDSGVRETTWQTVNPGDAAEQKVKKLYALVANLENWDYIPERSETEKKELGIKRDENAGDVLRNKGGTHSDLNRLFVSMVRAAGIPAYLIWVPNRSEQLFDDNFLTSSQFDAEIVIAQIDGKEVFLDPGSRFCPYGLLDWRYSGVRGLRQTANGTEIGQTPPANYDQSITTRYANLQLANDGSAQGIVTLTFRGLEAMKRRQDGGKTDVTGQKKLLEDEIRNMLPSNSDISLVNQPDWSNSASPLIAQFKVTVPLAVAAGKRLLLTQHVFQVNSYTKFVEAPRQYPVYFDYPWHEVDETHLSLPPNMEIENLAPDSSARLAYAMYKTQHKQEGPGKVFCRRELVMASEGIPAADYNDVKTFFNQVKAADDQAAIVRKTENVADSK